MPHDPQRLIELAAEIEKPLEAYLKWKIVCERYERGKNSKLSECIARISDGSFSAKESQALASEEYKNYLAEWNKAEESKIKSQVKYENLKCQFEALQSVLSYERESMKRLGG